MHIFSILLSFLLHLCQFMVHCGLASEKDSPKMYRHHRECVWLPVVGRIGVARRQTIRSTWLQFHVIDYGQLAFAGNRSPATQIISKQI
jgi:hypothetical protein